MLDFIDCGWHARYDEWIELYRQPVLIYNPYAGKIRRKPGTLQRTTAALARAKVSPRILATDAAGHATELAREAVREGADLVLVLGGDGTINEAANGLVCTGVPLGVLPAGTANVLSMELGLGSHLGPAIERLAQCTEQRVAIGRIAPAQGEPRYFLCMGGAGLDAEVVTLTDAVFKDRVGKLAYWTAGLKHFGRTIGEFDVRIEGQTYRCGFLLASRVRNYGGDLEIASGASLRRADFELVVFEGSNPLRYAGYMVATLMRRVQKMRGVRTVAAQRAEITSPAHLQIDGEYVGFQSACFQVVPDALTLLIPPGYR